MNKQKIDGLASKLSCIFILTKWQHYHYVASTGSYQFDSQVCGKIVKSVEAK